jgi:hypothetical protein
MVIRRWPVRACVPAYEPQRLGRLRRGSGDGLGVSERLEGELEQGWVDVVEVDVGEVV